MQSETTHRDLSAFGGFCDSLVVKSIKRSAIHIRRSMLDVRCSTFKAYSPPGGFPVPARRSFIQGFKGYNRLILQPILIKPWNIRHTPSSETDLSIDGDAIPLIRAVSMFFQPGMLNREALNIVDIRWVRGIENK